MSRITEAEWRDCYYLYRAMHDGVCPQCGHTADIEDIEDYMGNLTCPSYKCDFKITSLESEIILSHSEKILARRLGSFKRVRPHLTMAENE